MSPFWVFRLPKDEFGWVGTTEDLPEPCEISQLQPGFICKMGTCCDISCSQAMCCAPCSTPCIPSALLQQQKDPVNYQNVSVSMMCPATISGSRKDVSKILCIIDMSWQLPVSPRNVLHPIVTTHRNNPTDCMLKLKFLFGTWDIHIKETLELNVFTY